MYLWLTVLVIVYIDIDFQIKGRYYVDTVFYLELFKANNSTVIIFI